jgi:hypothetical protein
MAAGDLAPFVFTAGGQRLPILRDTRGWFCLFSCLIPVKFSPHLKF